MRNRLDSSIPANNWKIIELYNKVKKQELDPSPDFQRKLVWKKNHKFRFIETILMNFPFPEIYIAPGELNTKDLTLKDLIVDGQQRCTTIIDYIEGTDVFATNNNLLIKNFSELTEEEKHDFLNYEVSIRYMKNANIEQIKEIFQRINSTEYSLNKSERLNAQWGESEFILFAKQIIEKDEDLNYEIVSYKLEKENKSILSVFFERYVFSENDIKRMLAMQYMLTLIATIIKGEYFSRNTDVQDYIENYNEEFVGASEVELSLVQSISLINNLKLDDNSYWFNKANLFSVIVELSKYDLSRIDAGKLKEKLLEIEREATRFKNEPEQIADPSLLRYFEFAKEAVNETKARVYRGEFIQKILESSLR